MLVGAVVGGVGASAAVSRTAPPINPKDALTNSTIFNDNYVDQVGILHNQILFDYYKQNKEYSPKIFFDYIELNKKKFGLEVSTISLEFLETQYQLTKNFDNIDNINTYILDHLPKNVDINKYKLFLNDLSKLNEKQDSIDFIKEFEEIELKNEEYDDKTKGILGSFFSTYRHSLSLWN